MDIVIISGVSAMKKYFLFMAKAPLVFPEGMKRVVPA
jgi:hypothetical protein